MRRSLPPLKALPIFIAAAETESFAQAAERQHVTLSAVSQQIKLLEQDLDCPLFSRTNNGVKLTEQGQQLLQDIKPAFRQIEQAKTRLIQHTGSNITISLLNSLATFWLIPKLPDFYQHHPDIDIRLSTNWSLPIQQQHGIDLIIGYGRSTDWPNNKTTLLFEDQIIAVCHPALARTQNNALHTIIENHKLLSVDDINFRQHDWPAWCIAHRIDQPKANRFTRFSNTAQAIQACLSKVGVFVTHKLFVANLLNNEQLIPLGKPIKNTEWGYYLIEIQLNPSRPLQSFREWLLRDQHAPI